MAATQEGRTSDETLRLLRAILLVLLESRPPGADQTKPEPLLHRAGLNYKDIGALLGKKEDAVRKAVERAKP
jgi:DNA-directed RNA polymerase specialized sigma24 family protein